MTNTHTNLVLIGMPGAGKSTIGVILAKQISYDFVDTDVIIQATQQRTLQDIVDNDGYLVLREIEENVLLGLAVKNCIIATGGSAVYSDRAMAHLKSNSLVIFLDLDMASLEARIHNYATRGLAKRPDQDFDDLFQERFALYTKYADITIKCAGLNQDEVCAKIIDRVRDKLSKACL